MDICGAEQLEYQGAFVQHTPSLGRQTVLTFQETSPAVLLAACTVVIDSALYYSTVEDYSIVATPLTPFLFVHVFPCLRSASFSVTEHHSRSWCSQAYAADVQTTRGEMPAAAC